MASKSESLNSGNGAPGSDSSGQAGCIVVSSEESFMIGSGIESTKERMARGDFVPASEPFAL